METSARTWENEGKTGHPSGEQVYIGYERGEGGREGSGK